MNLYDEDGIDDLHMVVAIDRILEDPPVRTGSKVFTGTIDEYFSGISFNQSAVRAIRTLAPSLKKHSIFRQMMKSYPPSDINNPSSFIFTESSESFEGKVVTHIMFEIRARYGDIEVDERTVIGIVGNLMQSSSTRAQTYLPKDTQITALLDGYPIQILSTICHVDREQISLFRDVMRVFIARYGRKIPPELDEASYGHSDVRTLFTPDELDAVYRYMGTRRTVHLNIFLNVLYDLGRCRERLIDSTVENLSYLLSASWTILLLLVLE